MAKLLRVLELYSGIGGMHCALQACQVAYKVVAAYDVNTNANKIYQHNFPDTSVIDKGIEGLTVKVYNEMKIDMILMSPPCQPFTRVGNKQDVKDARTNSFLHVMDLLTRCASHAQQLSGAIGNTQLCSFLSCDISLETSVQDISNDMSHDRIRQETKDLFKTVEFTVSDPPTYLLVENVKGFEVSQARDKLVSTLQQCHYNFQEFLLTPLQFGIPNSRLRYFLIAKKKPLKFGFDTSSEIQSTLPTCTNEWLTYKKQAEKEADKEAASEDNTDNVAQSRCVCGGYLGTNIGKTKTIQNSEKGNTCGDNLCDGSSVNESELNLDETKGDKSRGTQRETHSDCDKSDVYPSKKRKFSDDNDLDDSGNKIKKENVIKEGNVDVSKDEKRNVTEAEKIGKSNRTKVDRGMGKEIVHTDLESSHGKEIADTDLEISHGKGIANTDLEISRSNDSNDSESTFNKFSNTSVKGREDIGLSDSSDSNLSCVSKSSCTKTDTICLEHYGNNMRQVEKLNYGAALKLHKFLEDCKDSGTDKFTEFILTEKDLKRFIVMDIVNPCSRKTTCFTKRYGRFMEGAGSLVQMTKDVQAVIEASQFKDTVSRKHNSDTWTTEQLAAIRNLKLRYFTPREIANLLGFPKNYGFPDSLTNRQKYMALGNSLNVHVVSVLIKILTFNDNHLEQVH